MVQDTTRIALLSLDSSDDPARSNRRRVQGASLLERQVDICLALGCRKIWLHAPHLDETGIQAQHLAERAGAQFRLFAQGRQLLGSLRQQDELVVLTEGLLLSDQQCLRALDSGPVILRIPAGAETEEGFERLDATHVWAGAMVLPGRAVETLAELAQDIEPVSALLRAARSARLREADIPEEWLNEASWSLGGASDPHSGGGQAGSGSFLDPFAPAIEKAGAYLCERSNLAAAAGIGSIMAVAGGAVAGFYGWFSAGLFLIALGGLALRSWIACVLRRDPRLFSGQAPSRWPRLAPFAADLVALSLLAMALCQVYAAETAIYTALLTYLAWLAVVHLPNVGGADGPLQKAGGRELLWLGLAVAGGLGHIFAGAAGFTALALVLLAIRFRRASTITRA